MNLYNRERSQRKQRMKSSGVHCCAFLLVGWLWPAKSQVKKVHKLSRNTVKIYNDRKNSYKALRHTRNYWKTPRPAEDFHSGTEYTLKISIKRTKMSKNSRIKMPYLIRNSKTLRMCSMCLFVYVHTLDLQAIKSVFEHVRACRCMNMPS